MTRPCGCPDNPAVVAVNETRHAEWHRTIAPLPCGDGPTLECERGRPSYPSRTYIDDQFDAARKQATDKRERLGKDEFEHVFFNALRALPIGWQGTTADMHALVAPPADHHWWGVVTKKAARLGYLASIATQKSKLGTTNGSLVYAWERIDEKQRRSA